MRNLTSFMVMTLDGFTEGPNGEFDWLASVAQAGLGKSAEPAASEASFVGSEVAPGVTVTCSLLAP